MESSLHHGTLRHPPLAPHRGVAEDFRAADPQRQRSGRQGQAPAVRGVGIWAQQVVWVTLVPFKRLKGVTPKMDDLEGFL